jgi:ElaB/YqjD/DUF883 family membrane-anchored ribosome-binding protein
MRPKNPDTSYENNHIDLREDVDRIRAALSQTAHDIKGKTEETLRKSYQDAKNKSADLEETVTNYVKEHPVKTIAFSVLAGMIFAKLLRK